MNLFPILSSQGEHHYTRAPHMNLFSIVFNQGEHH